MRYEKKGRGRENTTYDADNVVPFLLILIEGCDVEGRALLDTHPLVDVGGEEGGLTTGGKPLPGDDSGLVLLLGPSGQSTGVCGVSLESEG